jgi:hypothetical protein
MKPNTKGADSNCSLGKWMRDFGVLSQCEDGSRSNMKAPEAPEKRFRVTGYARAHVVVTGIKK